MFRKAILIAFALNAAAFTPAFAAPEASVTVRIGDLDPETDEGAARLLVRIERAAREVCGESVADRYISTRRTFARCTRYTIAHTIGRIGSERLYSEFTTRYGHL